MPGSHSSPRQRWLIAVALLSLYLVWGSTYLGMRFAIEGFPPLIMAGVRFLVAGGVLYLFLHLRGAASPTPVQWRSAALVGSLLLAGDRLYVGNEEGTMTVLRAGRRKQLLGQMEMDAPLYSPPALVGDAVFLATASRLYLIAAKF